MRINNLPRTSCKVWRNLRNLPRTQRSLEKNISKLTTQEAKRAPRKTRIDKKPIFNRTKNIDLWELSNGNGNCHRMFPWYLEPTKKDAFNRSWYGHYEDVCKSIKTKKLRPEEYTLWHYQRK